MLINTTTTTASPGLAIPFQTTADSFNFNYDVDPLSTYGTSGNDTLTAKSGGTAAHASRTYGGEGNDTITGSAGYDKMYGGDGNDLIDAQGGHDTLSGGDGNDILWGGGDFDVLLGGEGNDWLAADSMSKGSVLDGGKGSDTLVGSHMGATVNGGEGNDFLMTSIAYNGAAESHYNGGSGWDVLSLPKTWNISEQMKEAWITQEADGDYVLHWFGHGSQEQTDYVSGIEQFNIYGTLYTLEQLLV